MQQSEEKNSFFFVVLSLKRKDVIFLLIHPREKLKRQRALSLLSFKRGEEEEGMLKRRGFEERDDNNFIAFIYLYIYRERERERERERFKQNEQQTKIVSPEASAF